ncbi:MAG: D-alanine--D-alanine ligase [Ignavibacteria bacterium]|nr:D-alanine--D-alanine ligase [Ignavibacteria bacterium]MBK6759295.1 D-alanine--D-alanine ligase [Ignavibacteria bacterium]
MNIAVLLGGLSPERNISFLSGRAAVSALRGRGHTVVAIDPARGANGIVTDDELQAATAREVTSDELASFSPIRLMECITSDQFNNIDLVFLLLHGQYGEDGYVQSLLDLRGIPYTGSTMLASAAAMDKGLSKMLFQVAGIPTPYWVSVAPEQADDNDLLGEVIKEINGPMVVKPNDQGSTVGMTILHRVTEEDLAAAIRLAGQFTRSILVERYIPGRELTVAVLGNEALPIIEIEPKEGYYDYANKYTKGKTEYHCPADLSEEVQDHVQNLAVAAHHILGCRAYSRIDFRLTEDNIPYCLEVNTIPGFTETSLVPMAARAAGIEFGELCEEIIRLSE